jgi:hypothetical protein
LEKREMSVLFFWRLWLKKRVARAIHLEALVREDTWQLCLFGGFGWRRELPVLFICRLWLENRVASVIHLEALVGEERVVRVIHLEALVIEESCPCYSFGGSGWRRELPVLFIWRLWLEKRELSVLIIWRLRLKKRVARAIHLETLVKEESCPCYSFGGSG